MEWFTQHMSYCSTAPEAESSRQPAALGLGDKRSKLLASSIKADKLVSWHSRSLLLPMRHSPSGWLTSFHREIGSSPLGMVQVPLEEGIQSRNERDPSLQGQTVLVVLDSVRSQDTLLVPKLASPAFLKRGKAESTPIHPLSHEVFHRLIIISEKFLSFSGKGGAALFFLPPLQRIKQHRYNSIFSTGEGQVSCEGQSIFGMRDKSWVSFSPFHSQWDTNKSSFKNRAQRNSQDQILPECLFISKPFNLHAQTQ